MTLVKDAPHRDRTYKLIGLAMEVHNELGPGHREADYHDALLIKLKGAQLDFEDEPEVLITLDAGEMVKTRKPDFVVAQSVIIEVKGRSHLMTKDDQAQVIGYFAALPECKVALFFNFGRPRLEYHRLFPPKKVAAFQRQKWGKATD
ncbi:MAG TPA: GxxExxY protein [Anaerolineae bacterium]|nr:GxxExxY protein [Anaerolineae bacterium]